ncbi:uncharacterized protein isoform X1 [Choristoneura fumiferana]|uniref:uncharacterized protein isoform X1 n=2 Tax=Choristoneura fumiferana TaxID=7141 RepID=UPI003D153946
MADKVNFLTDFQAICGFIAVAMLLAIAYFCACPDADTPSAAETYSLSSLRQDIQRQLDESMPPPTYEEVVGAQPGSSHPNSSDRTSDGARNTGRDTVQPDSEQASGSQNQKGESKDDKKSQTAGGSNFKSVPEDENVCVLYVDTTESTEENNSQTIGTYFEFSDGKHNTVKGRKLKRKRENMEKAKDTLSSSSTAGINVGKSDKENESCDKDEDRNRKLDAVDNETCDKKYNAGGEHNNGAVKNEKCEDDVISIANSEIGSVDRYYSAEDISFNSKYDTASGGN